MMKYIYKGWAIKMDLIIEVPSTPPATGMYSSISPSNYEYMTKGELDFIVDVEKIASCNHLSVLELTIVDSILGSISSRGEKFSIACDMGNELVGELDTGESGHITTLLPFL